MQELYLIQIPFQVTPLYLTLGQASKVGMEACPSQYTLTRCFVAFFLLEAKISVDLDWLVRQPWAGTTTYRARTVLNSLRHTNWQLVRSESILWVWFPISFRRFVSFCFTVSVPGFIARRACVCSKNWRRLRSWRSRRTSTETCLISIAIVTMILLRRSLYLARALTGEVSYATRQEKS